MGFQEPADVKMFIYSRVEYEIKFIYGVGIVQLVLPLFVLSVFARFSRRFYNQTDLS